MGNYLIFSESGDKYVLKHYGTKGMHWGIRRYQNLDGSLTDEGKKRYSTGDGVHTKSSHKGTSVFAGNSNLSEGNNSGKNYSNWTEDDYKEYVSQDTLDSPVNGYSESTPPAQRKGLSEKQIKALKIAGAVAATAAVAGLATYAVYKHKASIPKLDANGNELTKDQWKSMSKDQKQVAKELERYRMQNGKISKAGKARYDTKNYTKIDPMTATDAQRKKLATQLEAEKNYPKAPETPKKEPSEWAKLGVSAGLAAASAGLAAATSGNFNLGKVARSVINAGGQAGLKGLDNRYGAKVSSSGKPNSNGGGKSGGNGGGQTVNRNSKEWTDYLNKNARTKEQRDTLKAIVKQAEQSNHDLTYDELNAILASARHSSLRTGNYLIHSDNGTTLVLAHRGIKRF